jgi:hypothetical protein
MLHTYLLIAWFALPVLVWGAMLCVRRRVHPVLMCILCLASMIAGIFILANYVWALDAQLLAEIDKYDPGTPEAERASEEWASDTDRSFLLLLSPVLTAIWYGVLFLLLFGLRWIVRQLFPARFASVNTRTDIEAAEQQGDDGNPYKPPIVG